MKHFHWAAALVLLGLAAGTAAAQDQALAGGIGYGGPLGAAVTGELIYGFTADVTQDEDRVRGRAGLLVQVHAGSGGGKLSVGAGGRARVESEDFDGRVGAGLKVSLARTWGSPLGTEPGLTYLGPEIDLSAMRVALTFGPLFRVGGSGGPFVLFSFGLGVRF
jgi:hypothetical protein